MFSYTRRVLYRHILHMKNIVPHTQYLYRLLLTFFTQSRCALSERAARYFETNSARWYVCCTQSVWSMCSSGWIRKRQLAAQFTIPHDHRARFWEIIPQLAAPIASAAQSVWSSFFSVSTPQYLYGLLFMLFTPARCSYRACCSQVLSSKSACWYVYYTQ